MLDYNPLSANFDGIAPGIVKEAFFDEAILYVGEIDSFLQLEDSALARLVAIEVQAADGDFSRRGRVYR
jgi:hypothetical protein